MKAGQIYKQITAKNGKHVTLRAVRWEDLDACLEFANRLVDEREIDPDFGIILDKRQTLETEAEWLGDKLASIERGDQVSLVAEAEGRLVGNSEVTRRHVSDEFHHGKLGISVLMEYRNGVSRSRNRTSNDEDTS